METGLLIENVPSLYVRPTIISLPLDESASLATASSILAPLGWVPSAVPITEVGIGDVTENSNGDVDVLWPTRRESDTELRSLPILAIDMFAGAVFSTVFSDLLMASVAGLDVDAVLATSLVAAEGVVGKL